MNQIRVSPEELRSCSATFRNESAAVSEMLARIDGQLAGMDWVGKSAATFQSSWDGQFRRVLQRMTDELSAGADHLAERVESAELYDRA